MDIVPRSNRFPSCFSLGLVAASLALVLLSCPNKAGASVFVWQGWCHPSNGWTDRCGGDPCPGGWIYTNNWGYSRCNDYPPYPGISDSVYIGAPFSITSHGGSMATLTCDGFLDQMGPMSIGQSVTINGGLRFSAGSAIGPGTITISPGATYEATSGPELRQIAFFNRGSAIQHSYQSSHFLTQGSQFHNESSIEFQGWCGIAGDGHPDNAVYNTGVMYKTIASTPTDFAGVQFFNSGTVDVQAGTFTIHGGSSTGQFHVADGAVLEFVYGETNPGGMLPSHTLLPGVTFSGPGLVRQSDGTLMLETPVSIPNVEIGPGGVHNDLTLTVTTQAYLRSAELTGTGTLVIEAGADADFGYWNSFLSGTILNRGTGLLDHPYASNMSSGFTFDNQGVFYAKLGGWGAANVEPLPDFLNHGQLIKTTTEGAGFSNIRTTNTGLLDVQQGSLGLVPFVQTAGETHVAAGAAVGGDSSHLLELRGGRFTGSGTAYWLWNISAVVSPGDPIGTLAIQGGYYQEAEGTLLIELGGAAPGSFDQLDLHGNPAALDGTLQLAFANGYVPQIGDSFVIMTNSPYSGHFARVVAPPTACENEIAFQVLYNSNNVTIVASAFAPCAYTGDLTGDGLCDAADVAPFVAAILLGGAEYDACADLNGDCANNGRDVQLFVEHLLNP